MADIESMYHCFHVPPIHSNLMKFYWFESNDPTKALVAFKAKVHIFGNCSSPAIAILGLRKADESLKCDTDCKTINELAYRYVTQGFSADDGLGCARSVDEAVSILKASRCR